MLLAAMGNGDSFDLLRDDSVWICDTGASNHSSNSKVGARNERQTYSSSLGHAGEAVEAKCVVDLPGQFVSKDGALGVKAVLTNVAINEKYNFNLLSLTRLLFREGWTIARGDSTGIIIEKDGSRIAFDIVMQTSRGAIFACRFIRSGAEIAAVGTDAGTRMNVNKAHALLGHINHDKVRQTAKELGWNLTRGGQKVCPSCGTSKAQQKNVCKKSTSLKASKPGERVFIDLSQVTVTKSDGSKSVCNKYWKTIVDESTGKKWCHFTTTKSGMVEPTCEWMNMMKTRGTPVLKIRMDPGGENLKLEKRLKSVDWQSLQPVDCEFTSKGTPQHNSPAENSFKTVSGRARAMMSAANLPDEIRGKVAVEAIMCAVQLDGLVVVEVNGKRMTRDQHMYGSNARWSKHMRVFGEAGIVKIGKDGKTGERGIKMMFVGYPANRESDSKRMYNPVTNRVSTTRDILWLCEMYYAPKEDSMNEVVTYLSGDEEATDDATSTGSDEDEDSIPDNNQGDESVAGEGESESVATTRSGRSVRPRDRLIETMAANMTEMTGSALDLRMMSALNEIDEYEVMAASYGMQEIELGLVGAGVASGGFTNTKQLKVLNYEQAMNSEDAEEWKAEVVKEKERFDKYNAFTAVKRSELKTGAKVLTTVWAFKWKPNGDRRGRMNARGFEQYDGIHYYSDSISSPVTSPVAVRIGFTLLAMNPDWIAAVIDVEGAFLQGKFFNGEEIYVEIPEGFEEWYDDDEVLRMNVPIYGTKQASQCFYRAFVEAMKKLGYKRSKADPCMFYEWINGRLVLFMCWIDDIIIFGTPKDVQEVESKIMSVFECKSEGEVTEYVGSKITITRDDEGLGTVKFTQPVLIQKLKDEYDVPEGRAPNTPAREGQVLVRGDGSGQLSAADATSFRSATAIINFQVQWSRPDCCNATRDLARQMSAPREAHMSALYSLIRYVASTPNRGWTLSPNVPWSGERDFEFEISGRADSDYAANTDDRRSVTGGRTFLNNCPIIVRSSTQKTVSLSVTEAEQNAGVTTAQDMMFVFRLLEGLGLKVKLPMILEMDNKGAVYLANNWSVGGRTRHIDVKGHYLRELKEQGLLIIRHIPGELNEADICTKNTSRKVFERHVRKFVGEDEYLSTSEDA